MHFAKIEKNKYLIRLERNEEINSSIYKFCESQNIINATIQAIGSVENPTLAHYNVNNKKYTEKLLSGIFELTNLTGNIASFKNKPLIHSHATFSDSNMHVFAGHLVKATVSATCEIFLTKFTTILSKSYNKNIGLNLWNLLNEL